MGSEQVAPTLVILALSDLGSTVVLDVDATIVVAHSEKELTSIGLTERHPHVSLPCGAAPAAPPCSRTGGQRSPSAFFTRGLMAASLAVVLGVGAIAQRLR